MKPFVDEPSQGGVVGLAFGPGRAKGMALLNDAVVSAPMRHLSMPAWEKKPVLPVYKAVGPEAKKTWQVAHRAICGRSLRADSLLALQVKGMTNLIWSY